MTTHPNLPRSISLFGRDIDDPTILAMIPGATGYGSHRLLMALALAWFQSDPNAGIPPLGMITEMGLGEGSTPFIAAHVARHDAVRLCADTDSAYFTRYFKYMARQEGGVLSAFCLPGGKSGEGRIETRAFDSWDKWAEFYKMSRPGITLIDHAPGERRTIDLARIADTSMFVIVHDSEKIGAGDYKLEPSFAKYKHRLDDYPNGAGTTLVSNFVDVNTAPWVAGLARLREVLQSL